MKAEIEIFLCGINAFLSDRENCLLHIVIICLQLACSNRSLCLVCSDTVGKPQLLLDHLISLLGSDD